MPKFLGSFFTGTMHAKTPDVIYKQAGKDIRSLFMRNSAIHLFVKVDQNVNLEVHEATFPDDNDVWIEFDIFDAGDTSICVGKLMLTLRDESINIEVARLEQRAKEGGVLEAILRYAAGYYGLPMRPAPELSARSMRAYAALITASRLPSRDIFFDNVGGH